MRLLLIALCLSTPLFAGQIQGVLEDGTNGGEGSAQLVQLVHPQTGMNAIAQATDVTGKFTLYFDGDVPNGILLLQAIKDGVTYTLSQVDANVVNRLRVFESSPDANVVLQMGYTGIYAYEDKIELLHFYYLDNINQPPKSRIGGDPVVDIPAPIGHKMLEASIQRGTMPLRQPITVENDRAIANFAVKPGRTTLVVRATYDKTEMLKIPVLDPTQTGKLVVMPMSMTAQGPGVRFVGPDQQNNMNLYEYQTPAGEESFSVLLGGTPDSGRGQAVSGMGSSTGAATGANTGARQQAASNAPIVNRENAVGRFRWPIAAGLLSLMTLVVVLTWKR